MSIAFNYIFDFWAVSVIDIWQLMDHIKTKNCVGMNYFIVTVAIWLYEEELEDLISQTASSSFRINLIQFNSTLIVLKKISS